MEISVENREEFLTAGYVASFWKIVLVSYAKFVQFVQNRNIVKTRFVFPTKDRNVGSISAALSCLVSRALFPNSRW